MRMIEIKQPQVYDIFVGKKILIHFLTIYMLLFHRSRHPLNKSPSDGLYVFIVIVRILAVRGNALPAASLARRLFLSSSQAFVSRVTRARDRRSIKAVLLAQLGPGRIYKKINILFGRRLIRRESINAILSESIEDRDKTHHRDAPNISMRFFYFRCRILMLHS